MVSVLKQQSPQTTHKGFLVGTPAYNDHIQQIALALHEADMLGMYSLTGVDSFNSVPARLVRRLVKELAPPLHRKLLRRKIKVLPAALVESDWTWDFWRSLVHSTGGSEILKDWLWEKSELHLDATCAQKLGQNRYCGFIGTEFGCLSSIKEAKKQGLPCAVVYMSPHYSSYERWVEPEFAKYPELENDYSSRMKKLSVQRNARKDEEARLADILVSNSGFTTQSLISAGFDSNRIITVPLACADNQSDTVSPFIGDSKVRFMYAGPLSVRKGAHILLDLWKNAAFGIHAELHLFGSLQLPSSLVSQLPDNVFLHGSVSRDDLMLAYQKASVLVFPTLLDGFGLVVTEALANGLPVITSGNAGAADLIRNGYNGFVFDADKPQMLLEQLSWCMDNQETLHGMRVNCLETAARNSWQYFRDNFRIRFSSALNLPDRCK